MEPLSSLHLLAEAVRKCRADIAPTYQEYIQLAFAIATDCGEAGRHDFLSLCSLSSKYDRRAADKLFSNARRPAVTTCIWEPPSSGRALRREDSA